MHPLPTSILLFVTVISAANDAYEYNQYLSEDVLSELHSHSELIRTIDSASRPLLVPFVSSHQAIIRDIVHLQPTTGVEMLALYTRNVAQNASQNATQNASQNAAPTHSTIDMTKIYNILRSISSLKGIRYFSASRQRMRVLFKDSYVIKSSNNVTKIEDPLVTVIPSVNEIYIFQEDNTFGKNKYRVAYIFPGSSIVMKIENITPLKYLFLPAVPPTKFITYFVVIPGEQGILFYGISCVQSALFFKIFEGHIQTSLYNRMKAVFDWFIERLP